MKWAVAILLATSPLPAQNLRDVPLGGRTANMGGAGVAAGHDAAMPYLNPAGIGGVPHDLLSLSASAYAYSRASAPRVFRAGGLDPSLGTDLDVEEERFDINQFVILPSSAGYFFRFGDPVGQFRHVASLSVIAVTYNDYSFEGSFRGRTSVARLEADAIGQESFRQVFGGPSYALTFSDRIRAGASVFASYSTITADSHDLLLVSFPVNGVEVPSSVNTRTLVDAYSIGLSPIAGVQARVVRDLWVGAVYEFRGIPFFGRGEFLATTDASFFDATGNQIATRSNARGRFDRFHISRPSRISVGTAWDGPKFSAAFDVHFNPRRERALTGLVRGTSSQMTTGQPLVQQAVRTELSLETRNTWNISAGVEYFVVPDIALRAGVLTDRDVDAHDSISNTPTDRLNWTVFTLGMGVRDGTLESSYGVGYRYGRGSWPATDSFTSGPSGARVDYTAHGLMLMLSGAIRTSEGERRRLLEEEKKQPAE